MTANIYDMKKEAIKLGKKGFKVIPCKGKHPFQKNWTLKASNKESEINSMWTNANYNIAILTGSNFIVVDCDKKTDCDGEKNFLTFLQDNDIELPQTLSATTGSGGKHYYFSTNKPIQNSVAKYFDGVDIRGVNGCVIAPPSLHPNGNRYVWDNENPIAPLPIELEDLFFEDIKKDKKISLKDYDKVPKIEIGLRNNTLFRLASKLVEIGLSVESVLNTIETENNLKCNPPLSYDEIRQIVASSFKYRKKHKEHASFEKIFNGNYNTTSISIYWLIWYLSLTLCKDTIYISQEDMCKYLNIKGVKTFRNNLKPLIINKLVKVERVKKKNGGYGVNSYRLL